MTLKVFGDAASAGVVLEHANSQSLHAAQHQPAFKWRKNAASALLDEGEVLLVFGLCADEHAAETVAVSIEELGRRVHDDVRAEFDRTLEIGRHEGVVDGQLDSALMADVGDGADGPPGHCW